VIAHLALAADLVVAPRRPFIIVEQLGDSLALVGVGAPQSVGRVGAARDGALLIWRFRSANKHRRHLTESQWVAVAAELMTLPNGGDGRNQHDKGCSPGLQPSSADLAKEFGCHEVSIRVAKSVRTKAPQLFKWIAARDPQHQHFNGRIKPGGGPGRGKRGPMLAPRFDGDPPTIAELAIKVRARS
jgi:hypothetical protein